jgi:hypothetical protein
MASFDVKDDLLNTTTASGEKKTKVDATPANLQEALDEIQWDRRLKVRAQIKPDAESMKRFKFHIKWLDPL